MNKRIYLSLLCSIALNATDLGTININSSTIDDKYDAKKLETSNIIIINGNDIEKYHSTNIAEVLNNVAGVTIRENEGDSNKIHIRGISSEMYMGEKPGVAIVIDGVPVQERAGSVNIDSDNIESIKIIKGGASYLYGNDALSGAIIITTKRAKSKNEGLASFEAGSYGYKKYLARYNASNDDMAFNIQTSKKSSDGYWEDSDYWSKSINGKTQYYIDDSSDITLGIDKSSRFENDTGSITAVVDGVDQIKTNPTSNGEVGYATEYDITLDKYFLTYSKDFENESNIMAQIYSYEDTTINKSSAYDSNGDGLRDDHLYKAYANTLQNGFKSEYRKNNDDIASMLGIDIARNDEDKNNKYRVDYTSRGVTHLSGEVASDTSSKENIDALYGEIKYKVDPKLTTSLNVRVDNIDYDYTNNLTNTSWKKGFKEYSYKLGTTYNIEDKSIIYANTSTGFRVPTLAQMYAGDMITSTYSGTYTNNTNIDTETTKNYELGFRSKLNNLTYDISVYNLYRDDVIGKSSGNYASTRGVDVQYDNMADIKNKGLELSINSNKKDKVSFSFNYTYLDSKYTRYDEYTLILNEAGTDQNGDGDTTDDYVEGVYNLSGNTIPRTSKHTVNLESNLRVTTKLMVSAELDYRSSQYADELNRIKIDGYSVVNLRTKYNTKLDKFPVEFFAKINNIFDKQYYMMPRVTGDRNDDGLYNAGDMGLSVNPGRVYLAGMSLKF